MENTEAHAALTTREAFRWGGGWGVGEERGREVGGVEGEEWRRRGRDPKRGSAWGREEGQRGLLGLLDHVEAGGS